LGEDGLKRASENAVLNANYIRVKLSSLLDLPIKRLCKHEVVFSDKNMPNNITTMDLAKRLLDYGYHAPTIYFPLIVHGAIMIEPTETETKSTIDGFLSTIEKIYQEALNNPEVLKMAPNNTPIGRLDDVEAARNQSLN
jgi:glycine dehydrogenase subunit 2